MDVVIGAIPATAAAGRRPADAPAPLEAKVLHVRAPRRTRDQLKAQEGEARRSRTGQIDPPGARVLVLLVPDAYRLPDDLAGGDYRVFVRFVRR